MDILTADVRIFENFVATELKKQITSLSDLYLYHFRTSDDKEIDFIFEKNNGHLIALKVKFLKLLNQMILNKTFSITT